MRILSRQGFALLTVAVSGLRVQECLEEWRSKLAEHVREFESQASATESWDRDVGMLEKRLEKQIQEYRSQKELQRRLAMTIVQIEAEQARLATDLTALTEEVRRALEGRMDSSVADRERRGYYEGAIEAQKQVQQLRAHVEELLDSLHASRGGRSSLAGGGADRRGTDAEEQQAMIREILDAHTSDLQWVERESRGLDERLRQIEDYLDR